MSRRSRVALLVAVAVVVVAGIYLVTRRGDVAAPPAAPPRDARPALVSPPATAPARALPEFPRWSSADGALLAADPAALREGMRSKVTLPNGLAATVVPSRSRYPIGGTIEIEVRLSDREGRPVTGRRGVRVDARPMQGGAPVAQTGLVEDVEQPGLYRAHVDPPADAEHVTVSVVVSETGDVERPGVQATAEVHVDRDARASLGALPVARRTDSGVEIVVAVDALEDTRGAVRLELRLPNGRTLGEGTTTTALTRGRNELVVVFPPLPADAGTIVELHDLTLFAGTPEMQWADFHPGVVVSRL